MRLPLNRFRLPYGPEGFQVAVGAWSLCFGLSLTFSENAFQASPAFYRAFVMAGVNEDLLGGLMLAFAATKAVTLTYVGMPRWILAAVAMVGAVFWCFVGMFVCVGMGTIGILSGAGLFCFIIGIGSFVSVVQFGTRGPPDGRR